MEVPSIPEWRRAVASCWGPKGYTTRLLLLTLAVLMERAKKSYIRVTREELAQATGLSSRWVGVVSLEAQRAGWLIRMKPRGAGTANRTWKYAPCLPRDRDSQVPVPSGTLERMCA